MNEQVVIVDMGSQYTLLIGRRLREQGVRPAIIPAKDLESWLTKNHPKGIILSGGPASIFDEDAPTVPSSILETHIPILAICLGMHWLVQICGGRVSSEKVAQKGYGETKVNLKQPDKLLKGIPRGYGASPLTVWSSHGDSIQFLPKSFTDVAVDADSGSYAIVKSLKHDVWGLQFHPEVEETEYGRQIFANFLEICGTVPDWEPGKVIESIREETLDALGAKDKCLLPYSGGVDSSVVGAILAPDLKDRLFSSTLDMGNLRKGEVKEIADHASLMGLQWRLVDWSNDITYWSAITDAEEKRLAFQTKYRYAVRIMSAITDAKHIIQGTLAPDLIESGVAGESAHIKTHHNIGIGLHPLRAFFKDEVRDMARYLELPASISERMPYPGPGLLVRVIGLEITKERLEMVRWADFHLTSIVRKHGLEKDISQYLVALLEVKTVGVKGDGRKYGYAFGVRAVQTIDFMTARGYEFPVEIRREIRRTLGKHPEVTRVFFNEDDKPPATIEFE